MWWLGFPSLPARHFLEPAGMMELRPATGHRAAGHRPVRPRLGSRAEVDVSDDADDEADEREVVNQDADFTDPHGKQQRKPHRNAGQKKSERPETDGPEEEDLPTVVLAAFFDALPAHVGKRFSAEPALLVFVQMHIGKPVEKLKD